MMIYIQQINILEGWDKGERDRRNGINQIEETE